ncbi:phospholipid/glycerol acyltransferase [Catenulispora acidiphila DSM 44928]|uniref:Phospholipid/glycerol acyltransferase n=1 Tax=Catenulispora acidiphila (strain DSM 44928 / JCM 14897 / NBRC 102108 / NRRL B-24433 / ID139908) TaxID=479433 RepID=C7Q4K0_CATAD|nr:lysophospholipid acyltransferase family protein [Catenulispora acidiphila]ACU71969.1 phospholipid/glycerol acyltransferase [Catenulispora acidiphila DSM 44928]
MKVLRDSHDRPAGPWRGRQSTAASPSPSPSHDGHKAPSARGAKRAHRVGVPLMHSLWHVTQHNVANVPTEGALLMAGNHTGFLDGPLIAGVAPRPVHFLVKKEMFVGPLGPILQHGFGQIPIDRDHPDRAGIQAALAALRSGGVLGVFPEGTRSTGQFESVHNGLAYFAVATGAPVLPVACLGTAAKGRTIGSLPTPRTHLELVYGTPLTLEELSQGSEGLGRRQKIAAISEELRIRLAAHVQYAKQLTGRDN